MSNSTISSICKNIDENPEDKLLLGILADLYEEKGDDIAVGLRWLIQEDKVPQLYRPFPIGSQINGKNWIWWKTVKIEKEFCLLPEKIFDGLPNHPDCTPYEMWSCNFTTLSSAMLAAAEAYVKVNPLQLG